MCGNSLPFHHISHFTVGLGCVICHCTLSWESGPTEAPVLVRRSDLSPEQAKHTYEPTALSIRQADGSVLDYPDHAMVGISAVGALLIAGALDKWNDRDGVPRTACNFSTPFLIAGALLEIAMEAA